MTERGQNISPDLIRSAPIAEIEGFTELREEENFYDQFPFAQVFSECSRLSGISAESLHRGISHVMIAGNEQTEKKWIDLRVNSAEEILKWSKDAAEKDPRFKDYNFKTKVCRIPRAENSQLPLAMVSMIAVLMEFPYWREYLRDKLQPAYYQFDGSYKNKTKSEYLPVPTYLEYAATRKRRAENTVTYGINDVFYKSGLETATSADEARRNLGIIPTRRTYVLRRADTNSTEDK
ncbi:MAG TPA: hypothetical protein VLF89_00625 [Candidatus Saccharimonadales bacterium]|nr:hypothetical protein [Candidatus Saccharimonadales bacterium]